MLSNEGKGLSWNLRRMGWVLPLVTPRTSIMEIPLFISLVVHVQFDDSNMTSKLYTHLRRTLHSRIKHILWPLLSSNISS